MANFLNQFQGTLRQSALLPLFFMIAIFCFTVMSAIYLYHWRKYSMHTGTERAVQVVYFGVSAFLILGALLSLMAL